MADGRWHYKEAQRLVDEVREEVENHGNEAVDARFVQEFNENAARQLAQAQVHATLALAASQAPVYQD